MSFSPLKRFLTRTFAGVALATAMVGAHAEPASASVLGTAKLDITACNTFAGDCTAPGAIWLPVALLPAGPGSGGVTTDYRIGSVLQSHKSTPFDAGQYVYLPSSGPYGFQTVASHTPWNTTVAGTLVADANTQAAGSISSFFERAFTVQDGFAYNITATFNTQFSNNSSSPALAGQGRTDLSLSNDEGEPVLYADGTYFYSKGAGSLQNTETWDLTPDTLALLGVTPGTQAMLKVSRTDVMVLPPGEQANGSFTDFVGAVTPAVPEPGSFVLMALGLVGVAVARRLKRGPHKETYGLG